ncbi:MAG: hypothetical protein ACYSUI_16460 [Planctomycetota bacterium]|jgi:hypothetical protein
MEHKPLRTLFWSTWITPAAVFVVLAFLGMRVMIVVVAWSAEYRFDDAAITSGDHTDPVWRWAIGNAVVLGC